MWTSNKAVLLTGDLSYYQVIDFMIPQIPTNVEINLVTPHHGGNAGSINTINFKKNCVGYAITSTGKNNYGHPLTQIRTDLLSLGFNWLRTDYSNTDIIIDI